MLTERDILEQIKRRKDSQVPKPRSKTTWSGTTWGALGSSALSEAWDTLKGIPMLPVLVPKLALEWSKLTGKNAWSLLNAPGNWILGRGDEIEFYKINEKDTPLVKAIYDDYVDVYGSGDGFKEAWRTEPFRVLTDVFALGTLGASRGSSLLLKTGKLSRTAKVLRLAGKTMDVLDPGNVPGRAISGGLRAATRILPPASNLARIKKQYGVDAQGRPLETDLSAVDAAERFAAGEDSAPLVMTREGDELAAKESAIAFSEKDKTFDPVTDSPANIRGVSKRMGLTEYVGRQKIDENLRALADQVGVPHTHLIDPVAATRDILKGVITAWEQGDLSKRQAIADAISDLQGKSTSPFEARVLLEDSLQAEYDRVSKHFEEEYGKNAELMGTEVGEFADDVEGVDTPDGGAPSGTTAESQATVTTTRGNTQMIKGNWGGKYSGRYGVTDVDNLIFSHDVEGNVNPLFPERFQKRNREGYASQTQIRSISKDFDPELALDPASTMNDGAAIVIPAERAFTPEELEANPELAGKYVVLSGNARTSGYKTATTDNPEGVAAYQEQLRSRIGEYGLTEDAIQGDNPVLYRELLDQEGLDYEEFAREANEPVGQAMRVSETARADASYLDADLMQMLNPTEAGSLREALQDSANSQFIQGFINRIDRDKRSAFYDEAGKKMTASGFARIENALIAYVLDGEFGSTLIEAFADTSEAGLINLERGVRGALVDLADFKALIDSGNVSADFAITEDLAFAIRKVDELIKAARSEHGDNLKVADIIEAELSQQLLFETPLDVDARNLYKIVAKGRTNPGALREFIREYTQIVRGFGSEKQGKLIDEGQLTKKEVIQRVLGEDFGEVPEASKISVVTEEGADFQGILGLGMDAGIDIQRMMPNTFAKVQELVDKQGHTRSLLPDPDVEVALRIVNEWFSDEMAETIGRSVETSGQGMTIGDFIRLRTNFRKRLDIEVGQGNISKVGAGDLNKLFYYAITEDIDNLLTKAEGEGRLTSDQSAHYKETNRLYKEQMELQSTNIARSLDRVIAREGDVVAFLMDLDPRQLHQVKRLLGEEGFAEQQPAMLRSVLDNSLDADGNLDRRKLEQSIGKMKSSMDDLLGTENATTLRGILEEVRRIENMPRLRQSPVAKFVLKNVDRPDNLFYEITKKKGVFDKQGIEDAKTIFGAEKWEQVKTGLMGFIFDQSYLIKHKDSPQRSLSKLLSDMTSRDKNRLIDIFGEEEAKELFEMAGFWERHDILAGWHQGSQTRFHQYARDWMNMRTAKRLALNAAYWVQLRGLTGDMMRYTDVASISLLIGAFGGSFAFRKFIQTEAGRAFLKSGGIPISRSRVISVDDLTAAADFIDRHNLKFSYVGRRGQQAREEAKKPEHKIVPAYNPLQRFMRQ